MFEFSKTHNAIETTAQNDSDLSRKKKTKFNMRYAVCYPRVAIIVMPSYDQVAYNCYTTLILLCCRSWSHHHRKIQLKRGSACSSAYIMLLVLLQMVR